MPFDYFLKYHEKYDIRIFDDKQDINLLKNTHICFIGSPRKHPEREDKIILVADQFGNHPTYFEFRLKDISYVERLSNEVTLEGDTTITARIWVKKGSVGIRCIPFVVENINVSKIF
ncbi:MAG: inorganic pyrophosphatase Ppa [Proteobacteria bacterium]|nr:inorganic pyrophosphatase Ppa [Pseudomonadota bacterium]